MSEKPISSSREARRKTVGDVVTVWDEPPMLRLICSGNAAGL